eukprot:TRINITY_DN1597_c0_g1_i1.p1 TRINITY_DN1597_c0_g1~~TRINITY_DN1597_c0_g1_i1.p1  ORF type:complete len:226 (+),score=41.02 TRINITY_DN1597_c0_g1_i1:306-983(+)
MSDNLRHNENSTIFIGGISHNTTVNELKEIFKPFGHVTSLTLKNRYAFLVYEDPHDAMDAIRDLDGRVVNGVTMNVQMADTEKYKKEKGYLKGRNARFSPPRNSDYRLIVENVPQSCTWKDLKDHFRRAGDVCFADVKRKRDGSLIGVVEFKHCDSLTNAMRDFQDTTIKGSMIRLVNDFHEGGEGPSPYQDERGRSREKRGRSPSPGHGIHTGCSPPRSVSPYR